MKPLLDVRDLSLGFATDRGLLKAVEGVSFTVAEGETFALLGESGCGKSVTAQALMRLLPANGRVLAGEVHLQGESLLALPEMTMRQVRGADMAMIFQESATSLNPVMTVGDQIGEVLDRQPELSTDARRARAESLLRLVGIADPARRLEEYPFQLSGGMKQRVMIAMALAGQPRLLIADEPTTALDVTVQAQILDLLAKLQAEQAMGMVLITHDLGVVARMAHRIGVMYAGELVEVAAREDFFNRPAHPYTQALFASLPDGQKGRDLQTIPGQVPALHAMPVGCRFADRCPKVMPVCRENAPLWQSVAPGHSVRCHGLGQGAVVAPEAREAVPDVAVAPAADTVLALRDLKVHFPIRKGFFQRVVGHVKAVDGVSLSLARGRTLALVGESGCGKTTVGKAALQLIAAREGSSVQVGGEELTRLSSSDLRQARRQIQMIFQDPFASLNPRLRVGEIIEEGMLALGERMTPEARRQRVETLLQQVGLDPLAWQRYPHEFSGGQRQRIAIARALAVAPRVLVCDEPTSALDVSVQAQILNLLKALQMELGVAYLFITHNFAVVRHLADEVAVMYLGRIVEQGPAEAVLNTPAHPYTRALLSAVPTLEPARQQAVIRLPGETPSPAKPPAGCHFHPRCAQASEVCRQAYPEETALAGGQRVACHLYGSGEPDR